MRPKGPEALIWQPLALFGSRLILQLALDDFRQGDVGKAHARSGHDERTLAGGELADPFGDDIDKQLLAGDHFERFFEKLAGHRADEHGAGKNGAGLWMANLCLSNGFLKNLQRLG